MVQLLDLVLVVYSVLLYLTGLNFNKALGLFNTLFFLLGYTLEQNHTVTKSSEAILNSVRPWFLD